MERFTIPTDEQLKVRPFFAEVVGHFDENYCPTHSTYHISKFMDFHFDIACKTLLGAQELAELMNNIAQEVK